MQKNIFLLFISAISLFANVSESKVCQKCHPLIYKEYYNSSHRKASIYNVVIHKAVWEKQNSEQNATYTCAKCHTPSDLKVLKTGILKKDDTQINNPISCVYCHTIKSIKSGEHSNLNILSGKKREFYTAEVSKRNEKEASYKIKTSWFGLIKESQNSPYHKIIYTNKNFYNGKMCMGCHSHLENEHGLNTVMLDAYIDKKDKNNCISCHMPQVAGSKVTLHKSKTHAYHGIAGIYNMNAQMGKYIDFKLSKNPKGFAITVINKSNHAFFGQDFRVGELRVSIVRGSKNIILKPFIFTRILSKNDKEVMPWVADATLKDTLLYGKKTIQYDEILKKGDELIVSIGVRLLSQNGAKALNLQDDKKLSKFRVLKTEKIYE